MFGCVGAPCNRVSIIIIESVTVRDALRPPLLGMATAEPRPTF